MSPKENNTQRVALYIRVSTEEQVEKFGKDHQMSSMMSLIESRSSTDNKLQFAGKQYVYFDDGVSGTTPINERPGFIKLQEDILNTTPEERPFDTVAVYKIDRFARKLKILLNVTEFFSENNIKFISVNENIDTSTPFGKAMLNILGVIAELEIETIKERTKGGREEAAKSGVIMGNASIFGYKKDIDKHAKILEEEAKIVQLIFNLFVIDKLTPGLIAKRLGRLKILSPEASAIHYKKHAGKTKKRNNPHHWTPVAIGRILADEIYIGNYYYNKSKLGKKLPKEEWSLSPHPVPQIIDNLTFGKAKKLLLQGKHQRRRTPSGHSYLLSGLLRCNCCHQLDKTSFRGRIYWTGSRKAIGKGKISHYYNCGRKRSSRYDSVCPSLPLPAKDMEEFVVKYTKDLLSNPIATFEYQRKLKSTKSEIKHLRDQEQLYIDNIEGIPGRKRNLLTQNEHGYISSVGLKKRMKRLNAEHMKYENNLTEIRKQISENTMSEGYYQTLELFSKKYTHALNSIYKNREEIYSILHKLIEEIIVYCRPVRKSDKIAGKKREGQQIAHKIHIKLKLPQEILSEIYSSSSRQDNIVGAR